MPDRMLFHQLFDKESSTYTYLIGDPDSKEAVLIDPVAEMMGRDLTLISELGVRLKYVLDTHIHADHITGASEIRKQTGALTAVGAGAKVACADITLEHEQVLDFGKYKIRALATPGHTNSCMSFVVGDRVFTGDCLLIRGTGRADFQQGDARTLYRSITEVLFALPDDTKVFPGHDYSGFSQSTIGLEKQFNARVGNKRGENEFVQIMDNLNLPLPKKIAEAVPANLNCGKQPRPGESAFRVLILGAGAGGISVASRLRRRLPKGSIAVVDPAEHHYYQPLWTLVGAGLIKKEATRRRQQDLIPRGVTWVRDAVARVSPEERTVETVSGKSLRYDLLIVATGLKLDFHKIAGLEGQLGRNGIVSIYDYEGAERAAEAFQSFRGGRALFVMPPVPIKCAGAPQKILYLADEIFRKSRVRDKTQLTFAVAGKVIFGVPEFATVLLDVVKRKDIDVRYSHKLVEVDAKARIAVFEVSDGDAVRRVSLPFDLLHVVPSMSAHDYVRESGLAWADGPQKGWMEVDRHTLQHPRYPNVFGVGDVTGVPNSKTGAAIRKQAPVVTENALAVLEGRAPQAAYDGYSSCPLITGVGKVILAEFGYDGKLLPTFPLDPTRERRSMWFLKRYLLAPMYWHGMLPGRV